ncbi:MAG: hypothetical protein VCD00_11090 [Candidatus Hydrogenedentota bacterium]
MNCRQVHEKIEKYYEGVLPVADELGVDIHLVQCPVCNDELGGVTNMVGACNEAFDDEAGYRDLLGLRVGMDSMARQVAEQEKRRDGFNRKDMFMHVMLACVAIPAIWFMGAKATQTYSAVSDLVPDEVIVQTEDAKLSPRITRDAADLAW